MESNGITIPCGCIYHYRNDYKIYKCLTHRNELLTQHVQEAIAKTIEEHGDYTFKTKDGQTIEVKKSD